jgi:hypothetical protein
MAVKIKAIILTLVTAILLTGAAAAEDIVAKLDGKDITKAILADYVDRVLGDKYKHMLETPEKLRELAGFYIDREIILAYARKTVKKDDTFLEHFGTAADEDTMFITTILKNEVNDKVEATETEIKKAFSTGAYGSPRDAELSLIAQKRRDAYKQFITDLRTKHVINING